MCDWRWRVLPVTTQFAYICPTSDLLFRGVTYVGCAMHTDISLLLSAITRLTVHFAYVWLWSCVRKKTQRWLSQHWCPLLGPIVLEQHFPLYNLSILLQCIVIYESPYIFPWSLAHVQRAYTCACELPQQDTSVWLPWLHLISYDITLAKTRFIQSKIDKVR